MQSAVTLLSSVSWLPQGREGVRELVKKVAEQARDLPTLTFTAIRTLIAQLQELQEQNRELDKVIYAQHRSAVSRTRDFGDASAPRSSTALVIFGGSR